MAKVVLIADDSASMPEAASILKKAMPETPVILFTMYTDLQANSLGAALGVDFISKADGVSKLVERVDALLLPN